MTSESKQGPHQDLQDCLWFEQLGPTLAARPSLTGAIKADIAIVGGGFTGLWTALFLAKLNPNACITVVESQHVGFGASGRNGGWLMGSLEGVEALLTGCTPAQKAQSLSALTSLVTDVQLTLSQEGIDCDLAHGGGIFGGARFPEQAQRARDHLKMLYQIGFNENDYRWLSPEESYARVAAADSCGGIYTPHVATLNPAKLVNGLAEAAERHGVVIYENSSVTHIAKGVVSTAQGRINADQLVIATEGFTQHLATLSKRLLPVQSDMVATAPLPAAIWQQLGFHHREAFSDFSRLSTYLQRTADDRLIIGARGSYKFGGKVVSQFSDRDADFKRRAKLKDLLFPILRDHPLTHAWGGTLAVPRSFSPHIVIDSAQGMSTAGGYLGEGVGASYLFGKTLAENLSGKTKAQNDWPWLKFGTIASQLKPWEAEPLPWLGFNATLMSYDLEEWAYSRGKSRTVKHVTTWLANTIDNVIQAS